MIFADGRNTSRFLTFTASVAGVRCFLLLVEERRPRGAEIGNTQQRKEVIQYNNGYLLYYDSDRMSQTSLSRPEPLN